MRLDKEASQDLTEDDFTQLRDMASTKLVDESQGFYFRDYTDEECECEEFYLFAYGRYARKMRQIFAELDTDLVIELGNAE
ncbi:hypothetical protein UFOVP434_31 [uncultured Caudovirales phage]|uniref:Uncharacterized protein n=1 Tax=uncultured Caudovirales phage TaxID=2100421 RepID=A0A6J5M917_9CAUD|nr:hypothetical protein UFOVP434_31 [uncultured Caudovirales phage]